MGDDRNREIPTGSVLEKMPDVVEMLQKKSARADEEKDENLLPKELDCCDAATD